MLSQIDVLTESEPNIEGVQSDGGADEALYQRALDGRQLIPPAEIALDVSDQTVEHPGGIGSPVELVTREQLRPRRPMRTRANGFHIAGASLGRIGADVELVTREQPWSRRPMRTTANGFRI